MFRQEPANTRFTLLARLLMSAIFILSGFDKLAAPANTQEVLEAANVPAPAVAYAAAVLIEIFGGLALLIGFKARASAAVLGLFTLATAVVFHHQLADPNQFIHFMKNLSIAGGLLQVVCLGAGGLSLDGWLKPSAEAPQYFY